MGQAKQRKTEIELLKKQPKRELLSFGAFYKDDCDEGWSIVFNKFNEPKPGYVDMISKTIIDMSETELKLIRNGNFGLLGFNSLEETIEGIKQQMRDLIHNFNIDAFGTSVRPQQSEYKVNISDRETTGHIIALMNDIYVLQALGHITNDNYNGMYYAYKELEAA
jgi:hypothetical protein